MGSNAPPQKTLNDLYDLGFARVVLPTFQPLLEGIRGWSPRVAGWSLLLLLVILVIVWQGCARMVAAGRRAVASTTSSGAVWGRYARMVAAGRGDVLRPTAIAVCS